MIPSPPALLAGKSIQYVKICSLYGAGFYYIPGTDTCIKIGGWVRMQMGYGYAGNMTNGPMIGNVNNRFTTDYSTRNRGYITADARSQTSMGTLRAYIAVGLSGDNAGNATATAAPASASAFNANRAFIQLGGWTAGRAQSFYDFMAYSAVSYNGGSVWTPGGADTGDGGQQVLAYTAQFGNGLSGSISLENQRPGIVASITSLTAGAAPGTVAAATAQVNGHKMPDFVASLRVDQAWGGAQIMAALHDASASYHTGATGTLATHPANVFGYALGAGIRINAPSVGKGDYFQAQFNYGKGATAYVMNGTNQLFRVSGSTSGFGLVTDGVVGTAGSTLDSVQLTKAYSVGASYEHNWDPMWKTSLYGGYTKVDYNDVVNAAFGATANLDFSTWQVGSRTAWAPVKNLEVGVDIMYTKLNSANSGVVATSTSQEAWVSYLRVQRNFWP